nr:immunoglobulin heavy chain junction region [Mus musculus]
VLLCMGEMVTHFSLC